MLRVGYLGAYSIDNNGDALVGLATRQAVRRLVGEHEETVLAPELPGNIWAHRWDRARGIDCEIRRIAADDSNDWARGLDAVIIGGGGLINLHPAFRPFLLGDAQRWPGSCRAAWNAIGSQSVAWYLDGCDDAYAAIRACTARLAYRSIRNRMTERFLRAVGVTEPLATVPDPVLLLDGGADRSLDILREAGVDPTRRLIGFSPGSALADARSGPFFSELFTALRALSTAPDTQLVIFPFARMYGDAALAQRAATALPDAKLIRAELAPLDCWHVVRRLSFYLCARYHAMLAALAGSVPFLALDEYFSDYVASSKIRELLVELGLEMLYVCPFISTQPSLKLRLALQASQRLCRTLGDHLTQLQRRLILHYRQMLPALGMKIVAR
jgi:polysaccharide pyruvyl transferase WcaK-like protein